MGSVVRELREARGLSQAELGARAGYGAGAGVSISRFENGLMIPRSEKLISIAAALGVSLEALEREASQRQVAPPTTATEVLPIRKTEQVKDRIGRLQMEIETQSRAVAEIVKEFEDANSRASESFSDQLLAVVKRLEAIPHGIVLPSGESSLDPETVGRAVELLSPTPSRSAAGAARQSPNYLAIPLASAVARAILSTTLSPGSAVRSATFASNAVAAIAGHLIASTFLTMTSRNRAHQRELADRIRAAELDLDRLRPPIDALRVVLPLAANQLDYIATHGGHALERFSLRLTATHGDGAVRWADLASSEQAQFRAFAEIESARRALAGLDVPGLIEAQDASERERLLSEALQIVERCGEVVEARV